MKRSRRWKQRSLFVFALIAVAAMGSIPAGSVASAGPACSTDPGIPSLELVYLLQSGERAVTADSRDRATAVLCERLRMIGVAGAEVDSQGERRIRVVLPGLRRGSNARRLAERLAVPGRLGFYQWEAKLIGPERAIGSHPGREPSAAALAQAEHEWKVAGRPVHRAAERRLILAGAFPGIYGAVRLAAEQSPRRHCVACSALAPRFYMFDRTPAHRLIAGPVSSKAELRRGKRKGNLVLEVPVGVAVVSEQPSGRSGEVLSGAEPGWFALRDGPALTEREVIDPKQEVDEFGMPNVTFGFTEKGRSAFQRVTRAIAQCGQAGVLGPVTVTEAEALSCHLAVILDSDVKTRPIINFAQNPDGIDGRTGAQISGGFSNIRQAQYLAAVLGSSSLPIELTLVRQRLLPTQNS
jgi:SecD/SecF fusion protein